MTYMETGRWETLDELYEKIKDEKVIRSDNTNNRKSDAENPYFAFNLRTALDKSIELASLADNPHMDNVSELYITLVNLWMYCRSRLIPLLRPRPDDAIWSNGIIITLSEESHEKVWDWIESNHGGYALEMFHNRIGFKHYLTQSRQWLSKETNEALSEALKHESPFYLQILSDSIYLAQLIVNTLAWKFEKYVKGALSASEELRLLPRDQYGGVVQYYSGITPAISFCFAQNIFESRKTALEDIKRDGLSGFIVLTIFADLLEQHMEMCHMFSDRTGIDLNTKDIDVDDVGKDSIIHNVLSEALKRLKYDANVPEQRVAFETFLGRISNIVSVNARSELSDKMKFIKWEIKYKKEQFLPIIGHMKSAKEIGHEILGIIDFPDSAD